MPVPSCTRLLYPLDQATNVPVDTNIEWLPVSDASGYILTLETFTTGIDVRNVLDVGNITNYDVPADLPKDITIYITIVPYNIGGEAIGCMEETFKTGDLKASEIPPKFFTPNNDGTNDYWVVPNPLDQVSKVLIYNRYGKLIKHMTNMAAGWDGNYKGNPLPADSYWYQTVYKDGRSLKGYFSLVR